ncbi:UB2J1 enzyme, partial [Neopipo cinnamomea]|nr:UB2J1 enzyme [Neopipo cinnamomea]
ISMSYTFFFSAVKRLMKEAAELKDPTDHYHAQPLENFFFITVFTTCTKTQDLTSSIFYCILPLPLQANGRFEVGKKICLSISGHHPETWQPSWSIRTALLAIIGFMPTKGEGAIGSLDYTPEERKALAKKSQDFCCEMCGTSMKTALLPLTSRSVSSQADKEAKELARQISFKVKSLQRYLKSLYDKYCLTVFLQPFLVHRTASLQLEINFSDSVRTKVTTITSETQNSSAVAGQERTPAVSTSTSMSPRQRRAQQQSQRRAPSSTDFNRAQQPRVNTNHTGSTVLIVLLTFALAALIFRRICLANEYIFE